jgi:hypothetical protein
MEQVHNMQFADQEINIDGKIYINCSFTNCRLVYGGGDLPGFQSCRLINSVFGFSESASRTVTFLSQAWHGGFDQMIESIFMEIRGKYPDGTDMLRLNPQTQTLAQVRFIGFTQDVEQSLVDNSASMYTARFQLHIDGVLTRNLSVKIKHTVGSEDPNDLEVYPIEGYEWNMPYSGFQEVARDYYRYARSLVGDIAPNTNVIMENNFYIGGRFEKTYRFVVDKDGHN